MAWKHPVTDANKKTKHQKRQKSQSDSGTVTLRSSQDVDLSESAKPSEIPEEQCTNIQLNTTDQSLSPILP